MSTTRTTERASWCPDPSRYDRGECGWPECGCPDGLQQPLSDESAIPTTARPALMCGYCGYVTRAQDCPRCGTGLWRRRMNKPADDDNWQLDVVGDEWGMY